MQLLGCCSFAPSNSAELSCQSNYLLVVMHSTTTAHFEAGRMSSRCTKQYARSCPHEIVTAPFLLILQRLNCCCVRGFGNPHLHTGYYHPCIVQIELHILLDEYSRKNLTIYNKHLSRQKPCRLDNHPKLQ